MTGYIFGSKPYQALAHLVVARTVSGADVYVYKNQLLPADVDPRQVEHLLADGLIAEVGVAA